ECRSRRVRPSVVIVVDVGTRKVRGKDWQRWPGRQFFELRDELLMCQLRPRNVTREDGNRRVRLLLSLRSGDRDRDLLVFPKRQRLQRPQHSVLENGLQAMSHRVVLLSQ